MSDQPDPMDKAYAQAEAVLSDDTARAARRARVLAAVAGEAATTPVEVSPPVRPPLWRRGGWLVAASVAGLSVYLAIQVSNLTQVPQATPPAAQVSAAPVAEEPEAVVIAPSAAAARLSLAKPKPATPSPAAAPPVEKASPADVAAEPALRAAAPPPRAQVPASAPLATGARVASPANEVSEMVVVTAQRRVSVKALAPADRPEGLREAAAEGRTADVAILLAKGVPVDAADEEGDTALMRAVRGNQPAAAAVLRRHGASLERKNNAGETARDMAKAVGDAALDKALGLER